MEYWQQKHNLKYLKKQNATIRLARRYSSYLKNIRYVSNKDIHIKYKNIYFIILLLLNSCASITKEESGQDRAPSSQEQSCQEAASKIINLTNDQKEILKNNLEEALILKFLKNLLVTGQYYDLHVKGESQLKRLKFERLNLGTFGNNFIEFTKDGKKISYNLNQLNDVALVVPEQKISNIKSAYSLAVQFAILAEQFSRIMFKPFKTIFKSGTLEVVTNMTSKAVGIAELAKKLESFDEKMVQIGFQKPEKTRIVINDNPIVPSMTGPLFIKAPMLNIWRGRMENLIVMNPFMRKTAITKAPGALFHERSHSFLFRTFKRTSFINETQTFQEAFADFLSARFINDPIIAKVENNQVIRNISIAKPNITMSRHMEYHDRSVFISSLLWNARTRLGDEKFDALLLPILENLNQYRSSFLKLESAKIKSAIDHTQLFIYDYEYFLSIMLKTFSEHQEEEEGIKLVRDYVKKFELNLAEIYRIEKLLQQSSESFAYDGRGEFNQTLLLMGLGTAGVAVEGYLIYELLN